MNFSIFSVTMNLQFSTQRILRFAYIKGGNCMELFKLVGVLFVVVGFILKWDTIATVVAAGIITGLVAMMNGTMTFMGIFETLGSSFVSQRTATLFALTVGIIGICERYGLKDKATDFIKKLSKLTTGSLLSVWLIIRTLSAAFSLRLGGHVQFIRPIILPMAEGAAYVNSARSTKRAKTKSKVLPQRRRTTVTSLARTALWALPVPC